MNKKIRKPKTLGLMSIKTFRKIEEAERSLFQSLERRPTLDELAEGSSCSIKKVKDYYFCLSAGCHEIVDSIFGASKVSPGLLDAVLCVENPTETPVNKESLKEEISKNLSMLCPKQEKVLKMHFGIDPFEESTFSRIAEEMNLSKNRVKEIYDAAIVRLRELLRYNPE